MVLLTFRRHRLACNAGGIVRRNLRSDVGRLVSEISLSHKCREALSVVLHISGGSITMLAREVKPLRGLFLCL